MMYIYTGQTCINSCIICIQQVYTYIMYAYMYHKYDAVSFSVVE